MGRAKGYLLLAVVALAVIVAAPVVVLACLPDAPGGFSGGGASVDPSAELNGGG